MSTISHLDYWIFVRPLKLRIFFSLSTIYEVVCVEGYECIQNLTDLCYSPVIRARRKRKSKQRTFG